MPWSYSSIRYRGSFPTPQFGLLLDSSVIPDQLLFFWTKLSLGLSNHSPAAQAYVRGASR